MVAMQPVSSSMIRSVGYEDGNLYIQFSNGDRWMYDDVPEEAYGALMDSRSKGSFFINSIRDLYPGQQV